jgi:uncharacterized SAM-binding protein YcdF (DUF218 family)
MAAGDRALHDPIGADGFAMLGLSCAVIVGSLGLALLAAFGRVLWCAWRTPCTAPHTRHAIVLGVRLGPDGAPALRYRQRLARARALNVDAIILLGGQTRPDTPSESAAGRDWLVAQGEAPARICVEERSRHTLENLRCYRADHGAAPAILVTSRFHLARATAMARALGLTLIPCAAETSRSVPLGLAVKEAFLLTWFVVGRGFARWSGNARMLARVN